MLPSLPLLVTLFCLLLSLLGAFLSLWIVIPAPTMRLLPLSIGAPELSPWFLVLSIVVVGVTLSVLPQVSLKGLSFACLVLCGLNLSLNAIPLMQVAPTVSKTNAAFQRSLGKDYLATVPASLQAQWRPVPYRFQDSFKGISRKVKSQTIQVQQGLEFAKPEGQSLFLTTYRPALEGTYPTIIVIYGGSWQSGSPDSYPDFNRYMAAQGYTVIAVDYRHAPQYRFPAQSEDIVTALTYIKNHAGELGVDIDRVALMGRSAGAHLAMLAAYQPNVLPIQAVVTYYGPINLTNGYNNPPKPDPIDSRAVLEAFLDGTPITKANLYRQASPIEYVVNPVLPTLPPTLLVYGGRDHVVQAKYGRALATLLQAKGHIVALVDIPWADHVFDTIFSGVSNQVALYYTERFLAWALYSES